MSHLHVSLISHLYTVVTRVLQYKLSLHYIVPRHIVGYFLFVINVKNDLGLQSVFGCSEGCPDSTSDAATAATTAYYSIRST